jgi:hypothetical protein
MRASDLLEERVAELDQTLQNSIAWAPVLDYWEECEGSDGAASCRFEDWPYKDLAHWINVMRGSTGAENTQYDSLVPVRGDEADSIMESCATLRRITDQLPEVAVGPTATTAQFWVATQRSEWQPQRESEPSQSEFRSIAEERLWYAKPREGGMFTSTGTYGKPGMWRMYLDMSYSSSLFGRPWYTWAVEMQSPLSILEVTCAEDWVALVEKYSVTKNGLVYPDWRRASDEYDGVHFTLRAVGAIDGIEFECANGVIARSLWTVETTLWLRWRFADVSLVDTMM